MSTRANRAMARKRAAVNSAAAMRRCDFLSEPSDGIPRKASTGATSPMVKDDPNKRLIEEEWKRRHDSTVLGAG